MYAGWAAPAHCHATCTTVTHYVLLSRIDSYCEAVWNPIIISRQGTSQQQVAGDIGRNNNSPQKAGTTYVKNELGKKADKSKLSDYVLKSDLNEAISEINKAITELNTIISALKPKV